MSLENAFNLARRHSSRLEPDLLRKFNWNGWSKNCLPRIFLLTYTILFRSITEEDMTGRMTPTSSPPNSPYTYKSCLTMLDKVCPDFPLPASCKQFDQIVVALERRNSNKSNHAIAFQGMSPGEASNAMAARERGSLSHAQIQRRMTSNKHKTLWWKEDEGSDPRRYYTW